MMAAVSSSISRAHGLQIAERRVDEAGHQRPEALVILGLGGGRGRAQRAAVKAALEGDDLVALLGRVQADQLDGGFVGLGPRVAEERLPAETPLRRALAQSPCNSVCQVLGTWISWPNCSRTASTTGRGQWPSRLQPQPGKKSR